MHHGISSLRRLIGALGLSALMGSAAWAQTGPSVDLTGPAGTVSAGQAFNLKAVVGLDVDGTVSFTADGQLLLGQVTVTVVPQSCPPPVESAMAPSWGGDTSGTWDANTGVSGSADTATWASNASVAPLATLASVLPTCGYATAELTVPAGTLGAGPHDISAVFTPTVASYGLGKGGTSVTIGSAGGGTSVLPAPPVSPVPVSRYEYDAEGHPTKTIVAPDSRVLATQHAYDALGRRTATTDAKNGQTQFGYDLQDQLTSVTDPRNLVTQYQPTGLGDVKQLTSPDTGVASSTFDAAGNLKTRTDARGVLATYSYDALNRPTQVIYSRAADASRIVSWTYDQTGASYGYGVGRLTTAATSNVSTSCRYDALGRITTTVQSATAGNPLVVGYAYDAAGHVSSLTYPSGRVVNLGWANGQPQSISITAGSNTTPLLDQVVMSAFGPVQSWVWKLGATPKLHERIYDTSGRLVRHPLGNLVRDITYDDADRISRYTHYDAATAQPATAYDQAFSYDELDRLQLVTAATSWSYAYDANGNRTASAVGSTARGYSVSATSNRLDALTNPARTLGYDATGNTLSDVESGSAANYTATYSLEGRLASMAQGSVAGVEFGYDAMGRRVSRSQWTGSPSNPRIVTLYAYDQDNHLIGEYQADGTPLTEYVWFGDTPVAVIKTDASAPNGIQVYAIHADHLDTPRVILDASGQVRWRWMGEPFGASLPEEQPTAGLAALQQNLRFPGQQFEPFGGRFYNHFRDYDPSTGRYVQSDPIGLAGGINTYAYVEGNPLSYVDPEGLKKIIFLPPTDPNYPAALKVPDDPEMCIVISHGNNERVNHMNARELNNRINALGCKPKQPVKLDACRTGQGENSIAEQLAKIRKSTVIAPTERTWTTPWDSNIDTPYPPVSDDPKSVWNGVPDWRKPGEWRKFGPVSPKP